MCCGLPSVNRIIATGLDNGRHGRFVTSSYRYRPVGNISRLTDDTKACYHRCSRELRLSYTKLRIRCVSTRRASDQTETERGCGYLSIVNKIYTTEYHCSKQRSRQSARRRRCKVTVEQCQFHVHGFKCLCGGFAITMLHTVDVYTQGRRHRVGHNPTIIDGRAMPLLGHL